MSSCKSGADPSVSIENGPTEATDNARHTSTDFVLNQLNNTDFPSLTMSTEATIDCMVNMPMVFKSGGSFGCSPVFTPQSLQNSGSEVSDHQVAVDDDGTSSGTGTGTNYWLNGSNVNGVPPTNSDSSTWNGSTNESNGKVESSDTVCAGHTTEVLNSEENSLNNNEEPNHLNYFAPLSFTTTPDGSNPTQQQGFDSYAAFDFNPQTTPYLSPQHAAAAVGFPYFTAALSPDYPQWAHASGSFDFGAALSSPVDPTTSLKLFEQNFSNMGLFTPVGSPLHAQALEFAANYQAAAAMYPPAGKVKGYGNLTGQAGAANTSNGGNLGCASNGGVGNRNFQKTQRHRSDHSGSSIGGQTMLVNNVNNMSYHQPHNAYYHQRQSNQPRLDIGTWDYVDDVSAANKTLTRSGKIVPTPSEKETEIVRKLKQANNYNPVEFNCNPTEAKFFVIKSYSEDDIHRSVKYNIWCSTERGNRKLDEAYKKIQGKGPLYLMFSVNGSGHFCGVAEMKSKVDLDTQQKVWSQSKWKGSFDVKWIFVKDVPNSNLRHIRLENNENKPVTNSRDTQEIPFEKGKLILKVFHKYEHATSLFDDFSHYESKELETEAQNQSSSHSHNTYDGSNNNNSNGSYNASSYHNHNNSSNSNYVRRNHSAGNYNGLLSFGDHYNYNNNHSSKNNSNFTSKFNYTNNKNRVPSSTSTSSKPNSSSSVAAPQSTAVPTVTCSVEVVSATISSSSHKDKELAGPPSQSVTTASCDAPTNAASVASTTDPEESVAPVADVSNSSTNGIATTTDATAAATTSTDYPTDETSTSSLKT